MWVKKYKEDKDPKWDDKAAEQIFTKARNRGDKRIGLIDPTAENPIDVKLRQLAISSLDGNVDLRGEFLGKRVAAMMGGIDNLNIVSGRIRDIYLATRDVRFKADNGRDIIVSFDKVIELL